MPTPAPLSPEVLVSLIDLWLPIGLSAVAVFFLSMIAWTAAPHHKRETMPMGEREAGLRDALTRLGVPPGSYFFPYCDQAAMKTEEGKRRMTEGPWGRLQLYPKVPGMGGSLVGSLALYLVASVAIGYLGATTLPAGAEFSRVFQVLGTAGLMAYTVAVMPQIIWFDRSWKTFAAHLFDGVVYGLATAALFAWLWPGAPAGA